MTALVSYDAARNAVAHCYSVDDAKDIADKARALQVYAHEANDPEMEAWVSLIRLRARRRIGELSAALEPAPNHRTRSSGGTTKGDALAAAGLTKAEAHRCEKLARVDAVEFETYVEAKRAAGKTVTADEVVRMVGKTRKKADVVASIHKGEGCTVSDLDELVSAGRRFGTIYADPPWPYGNQATRASTGDHYTIMTLDHICALPVPQLAADDAHLHLWTTNGFLFDAKRVMESWGFEYRSCFVWVKPQMGMGNYWRVSHEFMLLGIRGNAPFGSKSLMSWGEYRRGRHSAKPEEIRRMVELASPGDRLELFGRQKVDGWTVWGNQIERNLFNQDAA